MIHGVEDELRVVPEVVDEVHYIKSSLSLNKFQLFYKPFVMMKEALSTMICVLRLSDFAYKELSQQAAEWENKKTVSSAQKLCQYLAAAEKKDQRRRMF